MAQESPSPSPDGCTSSWSSSGCLPKSWSIAAWVSMSASPGIVHDGIVHDCRSCVGVSGAAAPGPLLLPLIWACCVPSCSHWAAAPASAVVPSAGGWGPWLLGCRLHGLRGLCPLRCRRLRQPQRSPRPSHSCGGATASTGELHALAPSVLGGCDSSACAANPRSWAWSWGWAASPAESSVPWPESPRARGCTALSRWDCGPVAPVGFTRDLGPGVLCTSVLPSSLPIASRARRLGFGPLSHSWPKGAGTRAVAAGGRLHVLRTNSAGAAGLGPPASRP